MVTNIARFEIILITQANVEVLHIVSQLTQDTKH